MPLESSRTSHAWEADNRSARPPQKQRRNRSSMHSGTVLRSCSRRGLPLRTGGGSCSVRRRQELRQRDEIGQEAQAEAERLRREAEKRLDMAADLIVGRVVKD